MKCKETACWFCFNRCDICFKVLGFDSIKTRVNKINVTVCNQECRWYLPGRKVQTSVVVASPGESPPPLYQDRCCPLFTSHKKYFHVYIEDTAEGLPLKGDIAVCFGDGSTQYPENKLYGVYFSRNIHKQVLFEFFLSDSFNLLCPLPYNKSNDLLISVIKTYEDDGCIGQYLKLACDEFKKPLSDGKHVPNLFVHTYILSHCRLSIFGSYTEHQVPGPFCVISSLSITWCNLIIPPNVYSKL